MRIILTTRVKVRDRYEKQSSECKSVELTCQSILCFTHVPNHDLETFLHTLLLHLLNLLDPINASNIITQHNGNDVEPGVRHRRTA